MPTNSRCSPPLRSLQRRTHPLVTPSETRSVTEGIPLRHQSCRPTRSICRCEVRSPAERKCAQCALDVRFIDGTIVTTATREGATTEEIVMKMRAARMHGYNQPLEIDEVPVPD